MVSEINSFPTKQVIVAVMCFILVACNRNHGISGEYVASDANSTARLQLVETPDKRVSGQFDIATLRPNGQIEYKNLQVTGTTDDENISLSLSGPVPLSPTVTLSGAVASQALILTGGGFAGPQQSFKMVRGGMDDYNSSLSQLKDKSAAIATAREKARVAQSMLDAAQKISLLCDQMERFEQLAPTELAKFPAVGARYRTITAKMEGFLARDRMLAGNEKAFQSRIQISLAMNDGVLATNQLHLEVQDVQRDFDWKVVPTMRSVQVTKLSCTIPAAGIDPLRSPCERFLTLLPGYSKSYSNMSAGLADLELSYQAEDKKQHDLQSAAQQIN